MYIYINEEIKVKKDIGKQIIFFSEYLEVKLRGLFLLFQ